MLYSTEFNEIVGRDADPGTEISAHHYYAENASLCWVLSPTRGSRKKVYFL
jgi:hypothetical protein